ncbi:MAG: hypothetical protein JXA30_23285 [Deltaproteobacteria bacterium]|nr:hypothetical protein [Deltaproteobacteria bacterium]
MGPEPWARLKAREEPAEEALWTVHADRRERYRVAVWLARHRAWFRMLDSIP